MRFTSNIFDEYMLTFTLYLIYCFIAGRRRRTLPMDAVLISLVAHTLEATWRFLIKQHSLSRIRNLGTALLWRPIITVASDIQEGSVNRNTSCIMFCGRIPIRRKSGCGSSTKTFSLIMRIKTTAASFPWHLQMQML